MQGLMHNARANARTNDWALEKAMYLYLKKEPVAR
jgi:hypothetical protein